MSNDARAEVTLPRPRSPGAARRVQHDDALVARLIERLQGNAAAYWTDCEQGPIDVRLVGCSARAESGNHLYEFSVSSRSAGHRVLAKVRLPGTAPRWPDPAGPDRLPDLFGTPMAGWSARARTESEYAAMSAIAASLVRSPDDRFGHVRVFGMLDEPHAVILEKRSDADLDRMLRRARTAPTGDGPAASSALRNAGALLRRHHSLPDLPHTRIRGARAEEFDGSIAQIVDYLAPRVRRVAYLKELARALAARARVHLTKPGPLGLSHGDFSPRNVLADRFARVFGIDSFAWWREPVYVDISQFLVALTFHGLRWGRPADLREVRTLERYEGAFLEGYFAGEIVPWEAIRLHQCRSVLIRWAFLVDRSRRTAGWRRLGRRGDLAVWSWFARRLLDRLVTGHGDRSRLGPNAPREHDGGRDRRR